MNGLLRELDERIRAVELKAANELVAALDTKNQAATERLYDVQQRLVVLREAFSRARSRLMRPREEDPS